MGKVIDFDPKRAATGGLSAEAVRLFEQVRADFEVEDAAGLAMLRQLAEVLDHLRACQRQVALDGMMTRGSRGQLRPHPLLREITEARRSFLAIARGLNLDLQPPD